MGLTGGLPWFQSPLFPEPQAVKAPRHRPSKQGTKNQPVDRPPERPPTDIVIVPCDEADTVPDPLVLPVSQPCPDQQKGDIVAELERRHARVWVDLLTHRLAPTLNLLDEPNARGIAEQQGSGAVSPFQILYRCEAQVPAFVQVRCLRPLPKVPRIEIST